MGAAFLVRNPWNGVDEDRQIVDYLSVEGKSPRRTPPQQQERPAMHFTEHRVNVQGIDCTNGGMTSGQDRLSVLWPTHDASSPSPAPGDYLVAMVADASHIGPGRAVVLKGHTNPVVRVRFVPGRVNADGTVEVATGGMMGGNFVWTSDSRFPPQTPVPVHDRFEGDGGPRYASLI